VSARVRGRRAALALVAPVSLVGRLVHGLGGKRAPTGTATAGTSSAAPPATPSAPASPPPTSGAAPDAPSALRPAAPGPGTLRHTAALGPGSARTVPAATAQVVVVRGDGPTSSTASIELFRRTGAGWSRTGAWRGHVGAKGWTDDHHEGDLSTPTGTYTLSDAGGLRPDPGTRLPYHRSDRFVPSDESFLGEALAGSFDYVLAVDFNRHPGRSPLDAVRPQGRAKGGGIWLHVDHDGPTHGCVSVPTAGMRALLRELDPRAHPVVVMGHQSSLSV
jgi:L,D-peptidoglycan transpeptidase YkuD (ErfK/YbiS/YcfS/YnhG family)